MRMHRGHGFGTFRAPLGAFVIAVGLAGVATFASPAATAAGPKDAEASSPLRRNAVWVRAGGEGRARMKRGDCKGALDAFDEAIIGSVDTTLRRDRGLCHENLGHPLPAIEDFSAYLADNPNGPDADDIRMRLVRLQESVGASSRKDGAAASPAPASSSGGASASGRVSLTFNGASAGATSDGNAVPPPRGASLDKVQAWEGAEAQASSSPLRRGKGFVIGPYLNIRKYIKDGLGWGEILGVTFRYSFSSVSTVVSELGYSSINASGTASSMGGMGAFLGYEARLALDPYAGNAIYVGGGLGYEHFKQASSGVVLATFIPRGRLGYRHVFGPALGIEAGLDAGYAFFRVLDPPPGADATSNSLILAGNVSLVLGF